MSTSINAKWKENMEFDIEMGDHTVTIDAAKASGGNDNGPRPKPLMMAALAGCTGMDVVSILKKMKVSYDDLDIEVIGYSTEEHPKHFYRMDVIYKFKGKDLPKDKIEKAINLSKDKYCGVSAAYKKGIELNYEIEIKE